MKLMMKNNYDRWMKEFMDSWKNLDWRKTLETISKDVKYYENPLDEQCQNFEEVTNLWRVIEENQKDIEYHYQVLVSNKDIGIINWQMTRTMMKTGIKQEIDGIFQVSLNEEGKCTFFKQWRFTRNIES